MPFLNLQKIKLKSLLKKYQDQVNNLIENEFPSFGPETQLREACLYALRGEGKRFRPSIVLIISKILGGAFDPGLSALSVELFHTASLIADDLPCMDDDSIRRSKPALHKEFGTDVALLSSYALLGAGYECILKLQDRLEGQMDDLDQRTFIALRLLAKNNGLNGAPCGQLLDLYPPQITQACLDDILYRKTVIFFETAFIFGWLFSGGDLARKDEVQKGGYHFGMAFQIYDDFCDQEQDLKKKKLINYPLALGGKEAKKTLEYHLSQCKFYLKELGLYQEEFQELLKFCASKFK